MNSTHGGYLPHRFNFLQNIVFQLGKFDSELDITKREFVEAQHNAMVFFFEPRRLYAMMQAMNNTLYHILPTAEEQHPECQNSRLEVFLWLCPSLLQVGNHYLGSIIARILPDLV